MKFSIVKHIHNLSKREYYQFPDLISVIDDITTVDAQRYVDQLNNLKKDLESRFNNVLAMEVCDWMIVPFTANVNKADVTCLEGVLKIGNDVDSKTNFDRGGYMQLW